MKSENYYQIIKKNKLYVVLIACVFMALFLIRDLASPFEYKASALILVINKEQLSNLEKSVKSSQNLAYAIADIIKTPIFLKSILNNNQDLKNDFSSDETEKIKQWRKKLFLQVIPDSSLLKINVYDSDANKAEIYVKSMIEEIIPMAKGFYGENLNFSLTLVEKPLVSKKTVRPNLLLDVLITPIIGTMIGFILVILFYKVKKKHLASNHR